MRCDRIFFVPFLNVVFSRNVCYWWPCFAILLSGHENLVAKAEKDIPRWGCHKQIGNLPFLTG